MERQTKSVLKKECIYITGHESDYGFFQTIEKEVIEVWDCKIYENDGSYEDLHDHFMQLEQMNLVILLVSKQFLLEENFAKNTEFLYIKEKEIPVLPILVEDGLERAFDSICGDIHLLARNSTDYMQNLTTHLEEIFGDDELFEKIPSVFWAEFFLSYRKKDRQYALQLLRLLHSFSCCEDVSIWFDDFLTLGENYDEEIDDYLANSDLFLLAVTPSLLEEGNYVMNIEYPRAKELGKQILPIELIPTDKGLLYEKYENLPAVIDARDIASLERICKEILQKINREPAPITAEKEYYLGQAYLKGIGVEINHELGLRLLSSSAENGCLRASNYLSGMYLSGDGVERDYEKARYWRELNVTFLEQLEMEGDIEWARSLAVSLLNLSDCCIRVGDMAEAKKRLEQLTPISEYLQREGIQGTATNLGNVWMRLGMLCAQNNQLDEAFEYYCKAEQILEMVYHHNETPQSIRSYAQLLGMQGEYCISLHEKNGNIAHLHKAVQYFEKAKSLWKKLLEAYRRKEAAPSLGLACYCLGETYEKILIQEPNFVNRFKYAQMAREQYGQIYDLRDLCPKEQVIDGMYRYATITNVLGGLCESAKDIKGARNCYKETCDVYRQVCRAEGKEEYFIGLATADVNYAVVGVEVPDKDYLEEALEIMDALCERQPLNERYAGFRMTIIQRINAWPKNLG